MSFARTSVLLITLPACSSALEGGVEQTAPDDQARTRRDGAGGPMATPPGGLGVFEARSLGDAAGVLVGWTPQRGIGSNVGFVGDVDGDGVDDVVVAGEGSEPGSRAAYLVSGAALPGTRGSIEPHILATYLEPNPRAERSFIGPSGHVDGDSLAEFWIGAPFRLIRGSARGPVDLRTAVSTVDVPVFDPRVPGSTGDVNGDGAGDLLFSTGREILLFVGPFERRTLNTDDAALRFQTTSDAEPVGAADFGDLDGDGSKEVLIATDCAKMAGCAPSWAPRHSPTQTAGRSTRVPRRRRSECSRTGHPFETADRRGRRS